MSRRPDNSGILDYTICDLRIRDPNLFSLGVVLPRSQSHLLGLMLAPNRVSCPEDYKIRAKNKTGLGRLVTASKDPSHHSADIVLLHL